jgi:hypothetical protein
VPYHKLATRHRCCYSERDDQYSTWRPSSNTIGHRKVPPTRYKWTSGSCLYYRSSAAVEYAVEGTRQLIWFVDFPCCYCESSRGGNIIRRVRCPVALVEFVPNMTIRLLSLATTEGHVPAVVLDDKTKSRSFVTQMANDSDGKSWAISRKPRPNRNAIVGPPQFGTGEPLHRWECRSLGPDPW